MSTNEYEAMVSNTRRIERLTWAALVSARRHGKQVAWHQRQGSEAMSRARAVDPTYAPCV